MDTSQPLDPADQTPGPFIPPERFRIVADRIDVPESVIPINSHIGRGLRDSITHGLPPRPWSDLPAEERQRIAEERRAQEAKIRAAQDRVHAHLIGRGRTLEVELLNMHGPTERFGSHICEGCEWGGYDAEAPDFPCGTYEVVARHAGDGVEYSEQVAAEMARDQ